MNMSLRYLKYLDIQQLLRILHQHSLKYLSLQRGAHTVSKSYYISQQFASCFTTGMTDKRTYSEHFSDSKKRWGNGLITKTHTAARGNLHSPKSQHICAFWDINPVISVWADTNTRKMSKHSYSLRLVEIGSSSESCR